MKLIATAIVFLSLTVQGIAQIQVAGGLRFSKFPPKDYLLDKGWRFQAGDNPEWARPDFGDSLWKQVSLSDYRTYLPDLLRQHIGWFRLRFFVDSPGTMNQAVLALSQLGASDCYMNGHPFLHLGSIGTNGLVKSDNPHFKPFLLSSSLADSVTIAIRFATRGGTDRIPLFRETKSLPLSVTISDWNNGLNRYETDLRNQRIPLGLSFLSIGIGILFLVIHVFLPDNKLNLLFAGFCFCLGMIAGLQYQLTEGNLDISSLSLVYFLWQLTDRLCSVLVLALLSLIVFSRIKIFQWAIIFWFLGLSSLFSYFSPPGKLPEFVLLTGRLLFMAELLRVSFYAFRQGFIIPGITAFASAVFQGSFLLLVLKHKDFTDYYFRYNQMICFALLGLYLISALAVAKKYQRSVRLR